MEVDDVKGLEQVGRRELRTRIKKSCLTKDLLSFPTTQCHHLFSERRNSQQILCPG